MIIRQKSRRAKVSTALAVAGLLIAACSSDAAPTAAPTPTPAPVDTTPDVTWENYFSSSDIITILVPGSVGGGSDTSARFLQDYMEKYIPGNPQVQVINAPDVPTVTAVNEWTANASKDGLMLLMSSTSSKLPTLLGQEGVAYGINDWAPIMGIQQGAVVYVRADSPIEDASQLVDNPLLLQYAGQTALGGDTTILLAFDLLNMNVNSTLGYDGRGPARIALEQGESTINYDTSSSYIGRVQPLVPATFRPLFSLGAIERGQFVRDPLVPDLPHLGEVYENAYGRAPSGPVWGAFRAIFPSRLTVNKALWAPAGTPDAALEALRYAFDQMDVDAEFNASKDAALGPYALYLREDMDAIVDLLNNLDPGDVTWLLDWLQTEYDVDISRFG